MAQSFTDNPYTQTTAADTTLGQLENNDLALKSQFSGSSAPSNAVAGMPWMKTGGIGNGLRVRNAADNAWLKVLQGDANQKMWVYRNDACEGWTIDPTVTDRVLALKGGSQAYNANGGTNGGTWTQPDCTLTLAQTPVHSHAVGATAPGILAVTAGGAGPVTGVDVITTELGNGVLSWLSGFVQSHAHSIGNAGSGEAHNHGTAHRPAAAIGTLQYPDLA